MKRVRTSTVLLAVPAVPVSVVLVFADPPPPADPLFWDGSMVIVHDLTSSTAGWPCTSIIGVRVITQVSVITPTTLDRDGLYINGKVERIQRSYVLRV